MNVLGRALYRGKCDIEETPEFNQWVEGCLIVTKHRVAILLPSERSVLVDHKTVGQFTGLTDKNGVKVFEGDKCLYRRYKSDEFHSAVVKWCGRGSKYVFWTELGQHGLTDFDVIVLELSK